MYCSSESESKENFIVVIKKESKRQRAIDTSNESIIQKHERERERK